MSFGDGSSKSPPDAIEDRRHWLGDVVAAIDILRDRAAGGRNGSEPVRCAEPRFKLLLLLLLLLSNWGI